MNDVERASNTGVSRRTVAKAMAWSAPAIAVAATVPIAAASCVETTSFDNLAVGSKPTVLTFQPSGVTAGLSFTSSWSDPTPDDTGKVARVTANPQWNYLEMQMPDRVDSGNSIVLTITLSEPVVGLSFIIHDVDKTSSGWTDTVEVSPSGFTHARGSNITGIGTSSDRFRPINNGDTPISGGAGRVRVTWPGAVQTITVRYVAGRDSRSNQHIGIGDLSYDACLPRTSSPKARSLAPGRVVIDATKEVPATSQPDAETDS